MTCVLEFHDDPAGFLAAAGEWLAERPVVSTVVASVTTRILRDPAGTGTPGSPRWWLVVRDASGTVVGAAMRTAPLPPFPAYLLQMPPQAAVELARVLHARGEELDACNGVLPGVRLVAEETARLRALSVRTAEQMRLHELGELTVPPAPPGSLRLAEEPDLDQVAAWFDAFAGDAAEQAGSPDPHPAPIETREGVAARVAAGEVWLWQRPDGLPVHVTAFNPPAFGVARIGPVYTPREHRGHGYAAGAVAEVSRLLQRQGHRVCLFTDLANGVSNRLYERLGYRGVVDLAHVVIEPAAREDGRRDPTRS